MSLLYKEWIHYKERVDHFKEQLLRVETDIYKVHKPELDVKEEGTIKFLAGPYNVKIVKKMTRSIDQNGAEQLGGLGLAKKYSWSKTEYNKLSDTEKVVVSAVITSKPAKPGFTIEEAQ